MPAGARVIDLGRATLLPGLIDLHTHLTSTGVHWEDELLKTTPAQAALHGAHNALVTLMAGFTTCRDMGPTWPYTDIDLRKAIDEGVVPGRGSSRQATTCRRRAARATRVSSRSSSTCRSSEPRRRPRRSAEGRAHEPEAGRRLHQDPRHRRRAVEGRAAGRRSSTRKKRCTSRSRRRRAGAATSPPTLHGTAGIKAASAPASTPSITAA